MVVTPWGTVIDSIPANDDFTLSDIMTNGELIMLTLSGPETYYDYHGRGMGTQFLLCEKFAQHLGVSLRVELCKDTMEMVERIENGQGDIIAFLLPTDIQRGDSLLFCGTKVCRPSVEQTKANVTSSQEKKVAKNDSVVVQWSVDKDNQTTCLFAYSQPFVGCYLEV